MIAGGLLKEIQSFMCGCRQRQPIHKFCLDQECQEQAAFCELCESKHKNHKKMVFSIQKFHEEIIEKNNQEEKIQMAIEELNGSVYKKVNHAIQLLLLKQEYIQVSQKWNENNFQQRFSKLKQQIVLTGDVFRYKKEILENLHNTIKELSDTITERLKATQDLFASNNCIKDELQCDIHKNQAIDRICFFPQCDKQKLLCQDCERDHKTHREKVLTYKFLRQEDHHLNKVIIDQDLFQNFQKYIHYHFSEFKISVDQRMPYQLILQSINSAQSKKELQDNIDKLCQNIQFGSQNQIILQILNHSEFCYYYSQQIQDLFTKFNDYQKENNFLQSDIQSQIKIGFSNVNLSQNIACKQDSIKSKYQLKLENNTTISQDVACLNVSIENFKGPYVFNIKVQNEQSKKLTGIMGIGIAKLEMLQKNQFELEGIDRMCMITSEKFCYNFDDGQLQPKDIAFEIKESSQYQLKLKKSNKYYDFVFENSKDPLQKFEMEVQFDQLSQYVVFVYLYEYDTEIQIIN